MYKGFCFTETWLHDDDQNDVFFPKNFNVYRMDRDPTVASKGGGVAVTINDQFQSSQMENVYDADCESICVKVKLKPTSLIMYVAYVNIPDRIILAKHFHLVHQLTSSETDSRIVVVGDFNLKKIVWNADDTNSFYLPQNILSHDQSDYFKSALDFLQSIQGLPMFQLSNIKNIASNVLDLVFVNGYEDVQTCQAPAVIAKANGIAKFHPPIEISFEYHPDVVNQPSETVEIQLYNKGNYDRILRQLNAIDFAHIFQDLDVEAAFDYFYSLINQLIKENVPTIRVKKNNNKPKWWTPELQRKKNRRDKTSKRRPENELTTEYVDALKEFNELQDKLHDEYVDKVQHDICSDPSKFWNYAKEKQKRPMYPLEMNYDGRTSNQPAESVELFADYFESIYECDDELVDFEEIYKDEPLNATEIYLTMFDIESAIINLESKNSCGPDNISPIVIKKCGDALVWPLWILFQKTMDQKIPTRLKMSRVVPVFKKGKKDNVKNYRIVAISPVFLRIYESAIQIKLRRIVDPAVTKRQHGFIPGRSVVTNLMNLSVLAHDAFEDGYQLDVFYGDFKNAFDKVDFRILIKKFWNFGIAKQTAKWLFEFLVGRTFYVAIGSFKSRIFVSKSGVPAGSILGPICFLIFIDDIVKSIGFSIPLLLADDIKLACIIRSFTDVQRFQIDINRLLHWCHENKLYFNSEKCAVITIRRIQSFIEATYMMGDLAIKRVEEFRDLGIPINVKMTFGGHVERITSRARQSMGYIKRISHGQFGVRALKVLYSSYVRSKLEFASVIWDPHVCVYRDDIESVQKQFVMFALGDRNNVPPYRLLPYETRCEKLGLEKLSVRRTKMNLMYAYDLFNGRIDDENVSNKLVRSVQSRYLLRDTSLVVEKMYTRDYLYYQPIARIVRLINKFAKYMTLSRSKFKSNSEIKEMLRSFEDEFT